MTKRRKCTKSQLEEHSARSSSIVFRFPSSNAFPADSIERVIIEHLKQWGPSKAETLVKVLGGGMMSFQVIHDALHVLKNPDHPKNNWKVLVERVFIDGEEYLRLAGTIPVAVRRKWMRTGKAPNLHVVWGTPDAPEVDSPEPNGASPSAKTKKKTPGKDTPRPLTPQEMSRMYLSRFPLRKTPRRE